MSPRATKKDLELLVTQLEQSLTLEKEQSQLLAEDLQAARETILSLHADLDVAALRAEAAENARAQAQQAAEAAQAQAQQAAQGPQAQATPALLPKPSGVIRNLERLTGMSHEDYKACQRTVRNIVVMAGLDITEDFRRQSAEDLAKVYRAARDQHPVLKTFQNNWVTAELAKQFLQNRRKHAVRRGYLERNMLKTARRAARRHAA
ncbi:hypothetical protein C8Q80DRAFT_609346 [Daedaleopsis nitida]|nr:hypothetical protein C8Q80DRAFT_609346 [Daedaleopsis nitida]